MGKKIIAVRAVGRERTEAEKSDGISTETRAQSSAAESSFACAVKYPGA